MNYSYIDLDLPQACVEECSTNGRDALPYVEDWMKDPDIKRALGTLTHTDSIRILYEHDCWSDDELKDHQENLKRILWIAACDLAESWEYVLRHEDEMRAQSPDFEPFFESDTRECVHLEGAGYDDEIAAILAS